MDIRNKKTRTITQHFLSTRSYKCCQLVRRLTKVLFTELQHFSSLATYFSRINDAECLIQRAYFFVKMVNNSKEFVLNTAVVLYPCGNLGTKQIPFPMCIPY